ncbi:protoporphyrinogen/coproporphyrinogen III oxidase [Cytobacillus horneckiae]|uniref:Coproporphyrinogen III oxidase n=1 Tax=Cytobacillus horneckiae TaxID=549687 RepID=A0A2N0ZGG4_9BACI|nr:protoporphyrinogen oxidase [Cytobacillus horneckiae]MBN6888251.1 protoporphyrinogen oxidase [Cytobacillus horneckiae]MEC1154806.1 protoporphyrinogen oxidase [Cytobacillus horneckiae]MED2940300.1 protoporphyrinogen oxidase [Cytobacillus horneckiae]PKG28600.1 protoporphyrinogen oxidase [Cytobacillus horneckiae]
MKTVLVIGAGVNGLSAMYELQKWKTENSSDVKLVLAESSDQLGGKIRTVEEDGFIMEAGADSIVTRKAMDMSFLEELGLKEEVIHNAAGRSYIFSEGELKGIPADAVFGIPASIESLANTPLVSAEGKVEALKDLYTAHNPFTKNDSIGAFLEFYFGKELVEKQIAPVLSGVYSGKLSDLTIASTLPSVYDFKEEYGSIIKGYAANKEKYQSSGDRKFLSFKRGLNTLIHAYERKLEDVEILKNRKVTSLTRTGEQYEVVFNKNEKLNADYVVLSIPHQAAKEIIGDNHIQQQLAKLNNSSLISVYVGFNVPDDILPADGTGFIAANNAELSCNACTWTSRKWIHTSEARNLLVRLFYKSSNPSFAKVKEMSEKELLALALVDIEKSLHIKAEPISSEVTKWTEQMPTYMIDHPQTIAQLEELLAVTYPGVYIAGSSYYGSGIPDCIENGENVARDIIRKL